MRQLRRPRPLARITVREGRPAVVLGEEVEQVCENWLIEDLWWTERPLRRHYFELVTIYGRNITVFRDLRSGQWFSQ